MRKESRALPPRHAATKQSFGAVSVMVQDQVHLSSLCIICVLNELEQDAWTLGVLPQDVSKTTCKALSLTKLLQKIRKLGHRLGPFPTAQCREKKAKTPRRRPGVCRLGRGRTRCCPVSLGSGRHTTRKKIFDSPSREKNWNYLCRSGCGSGPGCLCRHERVAASF